MSTPEPPSRSKGTQQVTPTIEETVLVLHELHEDLPGLCKRVATLVEEPGHCTVVCDAAEVIEPDLGTVDTLARMQLAARRLGGRLVVRHASVELRSLLEFAGLSEIVALYPDLPIELRGQVEEGEEPLGVEEEAEVDDPIA